MSTLSQNISIRDGYYYAWGFAFYFYPTESEKV